MTSSLFSLIRKCKFFVAQKPTFSFFVVFLASLPLQLLFSSLNKLSFLYRSFYKYISCRIFSSAWFDHNIALFSVILSFVRLFSIFRSSPLVCAELGSWEGRSSLFILHSLPSVKLYCVDTWQGADEHQDSDHLADIENRFLSNVDQFVRDSSCIPCRMSTVDFFHTHSSVSFDFCYLDASHSYEDALIDIFHIVPLMKPCSFLIFDDYLWNYYDNPMSNCGHALNVFMKTKKNRIVFPLFVSYQVVLFII